MLKAEVFEGFKGPTTLLLWGDAEGMVSMRSGLNRLRVGNSTDFLIDGPAGSVSITPGDGSLLTRSGGDIHWRCSRQTIDRAADLIEPLISQAGHQFLDVSGMAAQVI